MDFLQASPLTILLFGLSVVSSWIVTLLLWQKWTRNLGLDWLAALFLSFLSVVAFTGWMGATLTAFGVFSLTSLAGILLVVTAFLLLWQWPLASPSFSLPKQTDLLLLIVLVVAGIVYFQPHRYILGGTDAGTYVNIAATLARTGDYVFEDEWMGFLREHASVTLREQPPQWETDYLQFVGWYVGDVDPTRVIPQFFSFHPVWLAIAIKLFGLAGAYYVSPFWMVLSLLAVYLFSRFLFGAATGVVTVLILAINALAIFFGRYPTSEPLTLLLLFSGFFAFQRLWEKPSVSRIWGIFAGLMFGTALLTRIDLPLLVIFLLGAYFWQWRWRHWTPAWTAFTLTFGVLAVQAGLFAILLHWPYTWNTYYNVVLVLRQELLLLLSIGVAISAILGAVYWYAQRNPRLVRLWYRLRQAQWWRWGAAIVLILFSAYAYFLRPSEVPLVEYTIWPGGTEIPILNSQNWLRLGWYLTPLGLLLATLGAAYLLIRESWERLFFFLSVSLLTTIQYVYNIFNTPLQIYAMRRYVPLVVPSLALFMAVFLSELFLNTGRRLKQGIGIAVTLLLLGGLAYQARYVFPQQDFESAPSQLLDLEARLEPRAIVIIQEESEGNFADRFGAPLYFLFNHPVATIRDTDPDLLEAFLADLEAYADEEQRSMQLLAVDPIPEAVQNEISLQPVTMVPFKSQMLSNTFNDFPSRLQSIYYGIEIYDVTHSAPPDTANMVKIDVGTLDALYLKEGFYYKEPRPGDATMRWTSEDAVLQFPAERGTLVNIKVRAMIFRPDPVPVTPVTVFLDARRIGQFTPAGEWQVHTFSARPNPDGGTSTLRFRSTPFNPSDLQLSNDSRDLGFLLDWVEIQPNNVSVP